MKEFCGSRGSHSNVQQAEADPPSFFSTGALALATSTSSGGTFRCREHIPCKRSLNARIICLLSSQGSLMEQAFKGSGTGMACSDLHTNQVAICCNNTQSYNLAQPTASVNVHGTSWNIMEH